MVVLLKEHRPLAFFGWIAAGFFSLALVLGVPLIVTFAQTGLVPRVPTAVLSTGLAVIGLLSGAVGLTLDSIAKGRLEAKRLAYLRFQSLPPGADGSFER